MYQAPTLKPLSLFRSGDALLNSVMSACQNQDQHMTEDLYLALSASSFKADGAAKFQLNFTCLPCGLLFGK
jgi:hypothetical protein